ncbi:MAG: adenylate/guanylate cyclase domain-containing protein [Candidatus Binatia bacterium]
MQCSQCQHENSEAAKFCEECGTRLVRACPGCGYEANSSAKFCSQCGTPLAGEETGKQPIGEAAQDRLVSRVQSRESKDQRHVSAVLTLDPRRQTLDSAAERRQLTVMFIDLVGSTTLSAQLDPEEYREVVQTYQETCATVIGRYEGHVAQYLGDGILVYFGYPLAHEDDAVRAVRTGLEVVKAMPALSLSSIQLPQPVQVRIGIHTGPVVVGEIGGGNKREQLALGETPNLAARVQGQAEPDTVFISAATYRLVEGLFACENCGQPDLKGISTPLTLYRVLKESEVQSRFEVVACKGLTPLVGREHEFELLRERWERVRDGEGQVILLSGEPGIGKSRLVEALKETVVQEGGSCLELRCSPYHQNSALYPVLEHVQRVLQFQPTDSVEQKLEKLEYTLRRRRGAYRLSENSMVQVIASGAKQSLPETEIASSPAASRNDTAYLQEMIPLFATLLSLPLPDRYPPLSLSPQKQKEKTHEALVAWLCAEAKQQAVTYAWEDIHWADPSTLELLTLFLNQVPTTRVLVVLTFRPEFTPPWGVHSYCTQLTLSRLGRKQVEAMVEKVSGGTALPQEVIQQIVAKTDGVPLFVEELTKSVVESVGARHASPLQLGIPATLQDALMARLDRLGPAKEVAQLGATLGREFSYELLRAVSPLPEDTLQQNLRQLVESELVFQSGMPPQVQYLFKHALVQDTAYQSLLKSRRQQLHQHVAQVLVKQFPQIVETQPELVAHHYTEAGLAVQAIPYWQHAGELTIKRMALKEAIAHLNRGMALIGTLPPSAERDRKELDLRIQLGTAWTGLKGQGVPEVWTCIHPALKLAKSLSRREALVPIYWGLWANVNVQGRVAESLDWVNETLAIAEASGNLDLLIVAHWTACTTYYWLGDFNQSQEHGDKAVALYDEEQHRHIVDLTNIDPKTGAGIHGALAAWMLGYPDHAVQVGEASATHAHQRGHPYGLGWALYMSGCLRDLRREFAQMLALAEEAERLGRTHGLPVLSEVLAPTLKGSAWLRVGHLSESVPQLRDAVEMWNTHGTEITVPYYRAVLAEGLALSGDVAGGLRLIEESLAQIARPGWEERCHLAEILRLKGWMLTLQDDLAGAEQNYLASLDWARQQEAKSWELRTSTSLARLWQQQGKKHEARQLLAEIYNWFTEGFDTKDLQEAKTLLDELGH